MLEILEQSISLNGIRLSQMEDLEQINILTNFFRAIEAKGLLERLANQGAFKLDIINPGLQRHFVTFTPHELADDLQQDLAEIFINTVSE